MEREWRRSDKRLAIPGALQPPWLSFATRLMVLQWPVWDSFFSFICASFHGLLIVHLFGCLLECVIVCLFLFHWESARKRAHARAFRNQMFA